MAPHAGTAGLKVLLAGRLQSDLSEAEAFLVQEGATGALNLDLQHFSASLR